MGQSAEKLTCISIILADDVYRDEETKKMVIVGTFNRITAESLPCVHPSMSVLFSLTDGNGTYDLSVAVEHERSGVEVLRLGGPLKADNPLRIIDVHLKLVSVRLAEAGKYWVKILSGVEVLQQRPFVLELRDQRKEEAT